jgi:biofilm protein TabA
MGEYHQLGIEGFYARIMQYPLKSRATAKFENHRHTIDIQYTIKGSEGIDFADLASLTPTGEYSADKDTEFFKTPAHSTASIDNSSGRFVIIMPDEPHMPQLITPCSSEVHKVVVKIPIKLLYGDIAI